jgi:hypothetical protein
MHRIRWRWGGQGVSSAATMAVIVIFLLGIANFTLHKAVIESGHPLLNQMPWFYHQLSGRFSLSVEFLILLAAMLLTAQGLGWVAGVYLAYSLLNSISAWLILTGRV